MSSLGKGVFVPIPTFFTDNEDLDLETLDRHIRFLSNTGIAGIIFMGSMGEAPHLSDDERIAVLKQGKASLQKYDPSIKILAGTGAASARQTIKLSRDAAEAGAEYVLVLPPSYYRASIDSQAIIDFFTRAADESPLPVVIYNYPGVTQGVDIDVDTIVRLSKHPNIVGIKGTDGNIGKVGYLAAHIKPEDNFSILAGSADFFLPALSVGAVGVVPGLGNICPTGMVEIQRLFESGEIAKATRLQQTLIEPDNALARWYGIAGVKSSINQLLGYGGKPRNPLRPVSDEQAARIVKAVGVAFKLENDLRAA